VLDSSETTRGRTAAILVAAGRGERLGPGLLKPLRHVGGRSLLERSVDAFLTHPAIDELVVALPKELAESPPDCLCDRSKRIRVVAGGDRRQDSVANAIDATSPSVDLIVVHDAARPFVTAEVISRTIDAARRTGAALAALPARDTVKQVEPEDGRESAEGQSSRVVQTLPRSALVLAQTPQAFERRVLVDAFASCPPGVEATDEAWLVERAGHVVTVVPGDPFNLKITVPEDLIVAEAITRAREGMPPSPGGQPIGRFRIGHGYDLHRLVDGRPLILGGVQVPFERGLLGHSDADIVCHAVTDAILGAAAAGDIGRHFPDADPAYEGASSVALLRTAAGLVSARGYRIVNVDVTVIAERPKVAPYVDAMRGSLAEALGVSIEAVSVKGKTNERVDAVGRGEAMAAHAVALIELVDAR